ncbi:MAG: hypothetical protein LBS56_00930 [Propionibacteriaceae bacterium]|jgi:hypothetical protein|nr:hypothetical protein [Propionibacteriaceae bacterium]
MRTRPFSSLCLAASAAIMLSLAVSVAPDTARDAVAEPVAAALTCAGPTGALTASIRASGAEAASKEVVCPVAGLPALHLSGVLDAWMAYGRAEVRVVFRDASGGQVGSKVFGPWLGKFTGLEWEGTAPVPAGAVQAAVAAQVRSTGQYGAVNAAATIKGLVVQAGADLAPAAQPPLAVTAGEDATWSLTVTPDSARGDLRVELTDLDGDQVAVHRATRAAGGPAEITAPDLAPGYYDVRVVFTPDSGLHEAAWVGSLGVVPAGAAPDDPRFALDAGLSWRVNEGNTTLSADTHVDAIRLAGVGAVRDRLSPHQVYFCDGQWAASPNVFEETARAAAAAGLGQVQVFSDPTACMRPGTDPATAGRKPALDYAEVYEFGRQLALNLGDWVDSVEYWNEQNWPSFFAGYPWQYTTALKAFTAGVKAARPDMRVLIGSHTGPPDEFMAETFRNGIGDDFDVLNHHHYPYTAPTNLTSYASSMGAEEAAAGLDGKAKWLTEMGVSVGVGADGRERSKELSQAMLLTRNYAEGFAAGYERVYFFYWQNLVDQDSTRWGLTRADGSVRPAYYALALATRHLAGTSVERVVTHAHGKTVYFVCDNPQATGATCAAGEVRAVNWGLGVAFPAGATVTDVFGQTADAQTEVHLVSGLAQVPSAGSAADGGPASQIAAAAPLRLQVERVEIDGVNQIELAMPDDNVALVAGRGAKIDVVLTARDPSDADVSGSTEVVCAAQAGLRLTSSERPTAVDGEFTCAYVNELALWARGHVEASASRGGAQDNVSVLVEGYPPVGSYWQRHQDLSPRATITSPNGRVTVRWQDDGDLVQSFDGAPARGVGSNGATARAAFQADGDFVLYHPDGSGRTPWATGTGGTDAKALAVQDDGRVVMLSPTDGVVWEWLPAVEPPEPVGMDKSDFCFWADNLSRALADLDDSVKAPSLVRIDQALHDAYDLLGVLAGNGPADVDAAVVAARAQAGDLKRAFDYVDVKRILEVRPRARAIAAVTAPGSAVATHCAGQPGATAFPAASLRLSLNFWSAPAAGAGLPLRVESTGQWAAASDSDWIHLSVASAGGSTRVTVTADKNPGAERRGVVTFKTDQWGAFTRTVEVTQVARPASIVVASSVAAPWAGAPLEVPVDAYPADWSAVTSTPWLTVERDGSTLRVTCADNLGPARTGEVRVTAGGVTKLVKIRQAVGPTLTVTRQVVPLQAAGTPTTLLLMTNQPTWTVSTDADWVRLESASVASMAVVHVAADRNTTGAVRTAQVTFSTAGGAVTRQVTVTQKAV